MSLKKKIDFCEKHFKAKEGHTWSLKKREWVRDEFWKAIEGYKLWAPLSTPSDPDSPRLTVCDDCAEKIGTLVEVPREIPCPGEESDCPGVVSEPILVSIINIPRQDGKTFNTTGLILATTFTERNKSVAFVAASEDQARELFIENYKQAIERNPQLDRSCKISRMGYKTKKNSLFEAMSTSFKSITGRTRTHIVIDEAREIEARVIAALIPAVLAMGGVECPAGHVQLTGEEANQAPEVCSACQRELRKWWPRIVITSSSGVVEDNETNWLPELIENLQREPDPNWYVLSRTDSRNPQKNPKVKSALEGVLGKVSSMKDYVAVEFGNQWTKRGDVFLSEAELKRCIDVNLLNSTGTGDPCVGFLDTSTTGDKTTLTILAEDPSRCSQPWEHIYQARTDFWIPSELPGGVIDEFLIQAHLETWIPLFPGLRILHVDTRGMPWAIRLVKTLRQSSHPWAKSVHPWDKRGHEADAGWGLLQTRALNQTIRLQDIGEMKAEFKGVKIKRDPQSGVMKVVDRDRQRSHKDITETLAICCYLAHMQILKAGAPGIAAVRKAGDRRESSKPGLARLAAKVSRPMGGKFSSDRF